MNLFCSSGYLLRLTQLLNPLTRYTTLSHSYIESFPHRHSGVSNWNSLFKSYIEGENTRWAFVLFRQMLQSNIKPNDFTFSLLIKSITIHSFSPKQEAQQIHTHILKSGFDQFIYVATSLLDLYAKSGLIFCAEKLFDTMPHRDVISWNSLICGYSYNEYDLDALGLFSEMLEQGISPCRVTMVSVLPSCARLQLLFQGKLIHGFGIKVALDLDSRVNNALISMYAKWSDIDAAKVLFEGMLEKDVISWNTMITAFSQNGYVDDALLVFRNMCKENVKASSVTIVSLLSGNAPLDCIHSYAVKVGLDTDVSVITSLICMYAKGGSTKFAQLLYGLMPCKNLVSLTAIVSSYVEKGDMASAVVCFRQVQLEGLKPDAVAMVSILHGFTDPTYVEIGIAFHCYIVKSGLASQTLVINGLIGMYTKFNDIDAASSLFLMLQERPLISWNSMIFSYVRAGRMNGAMDLFCQMKMFGYNPDPVTMASVLTGCSQQVSLHFGRKFHNYILRNNIEIEDFVATALIDMYAKGGSIESAARIFESIQNPCLATWNAIISGYGMYGLEFNALGYYSQMLKQGLEPDAITFLGVLSACSHLGLVYEGWKYFKIMRKDYGITPEVQHYACMVDLLGRAGFLDEAVTFIKSIKIEPDSVIWLALLGACCIHQEIKLAECVAKQIFLLDHRNVGFYVLMSNLYASSGRWDDVAKVREMMKDIGEDGCSGTSLIEASCSP